MCQARSASLLFHTFGSVSGRARSASSLGLNTLRSGVFVFNDSLVIVVALYLQLVLDLSTDDSNLISYWVPWQILDSFVSYSHKVC